MAKKPCQPTQESKQETKTTQELFALAVNSHDDLDELLSKNTTKKACRTKGPLSTEQIEKRNLFWLLRAQSQGTQNIEEGALDHMP